MCTSLLFYILPVLVHPIQSYRVNYVKNATVTIGAIVDTKYKTVDDNITTCLQSSILQSTFHPYITIQLQTPVLIKWIEIHYGSSDGLKILRPSLYVYSSKGRKASVSHKLINQASYFTLETATTSNNVEIYLPDLSALNVCEISIYHCHNYTFGEFCTQSCNCENRTLPCDTITGECPDGNCPVGYTGYNCLSICPIGHYGKSCRGECHCLKNVPCDIKTGQCLNGLCSERYVGHFCNETCSNGKWNYSTCDQDCECLHDELCDVSNGHCSDELCKSLRVHGGMCDIECPNEKFLINGSCIGQCNCRNQSRCRLMDGACVEDLCKVGWQGFNCQSPCDDGLFGESCKYRCGCLDKNEICDKVSGSCVSGCISGSDSCWKKDHEAAYSIAKEALEYYRLLVILGSTAGGVFLLFLIGVLFWKKRRPEIDHYIHDINNCEATNKIDNLNQSMQLSPLSSEAALSSSTHYSYKESAHYTRDEYDTISTETSNSLDYESISSFLQYIGFKKIENECSTEIEFDMSKTSNENQPDDENSIRTFLDSIGIDSLCDEIQYSQKTVTHSSPKNNSNVECEISNRMFRKEILPVKHKSKNYLTFIDELENFKKQVCLVPIKPKTEYVNFKYKIEDRKICQSTKSNSKELSSEIKNLTRNNFSRAKIRYKNIALKSTSLKDATKDRKKIHSYNRGTDCLPNNVAATMASPISKSNKNLATCQAKRVPKNIKLKQNFKRDNNNIQYYDNLLCKKSVTNLQKLNMKYKRKYKKDIHLSNIKSCQPSSHRNKQKVRLRNRRKSSGDYMYNVLHLASQFKYDPNTIIHELKRNFFYEWSYNNANNAIEIYKKVGDNYILVNFTGNNLWVNKKRNFSKNAQDDQIHMVDGKQYKALQTYSTESISNANPKFIIVLDFGIPMKKRKGRKHYINDVLYEEIHGTILAKHTKDMAEYGSVKSRSITGRSSRMSRSGSRSRSNSRKSRKTRSDSRKGSINSPLAINNNKSRTNQSRIFNIHQSQSGGKRSRSPNASRSSKRRSSKPKLSAINVVAVSSPGTSSPRKSISQSARSSIINSLGPGFGMSPRSSISRSPRSSISRSHRLSISKSPRQSISKSPRQSISRSPRQSFSKSPISSIGTSSRHDISKSPSSTGKRRKSKKRKKSRHSISKSPMTSVDTSIIPTIITTPESKEGRLEMIPADLINMLDVKPLNTVKSRSFTSHNTASKLFAEIDQKALNKSASLDTREVKADIHFTPTLQVQNDQCQTLLYADDASGTSNEPQSAPSFNSPLQIRTQSSNILNSMREGCCGQSVNFERQPFGDNIVETIKCVRRFTNPAVDKQSAYLVVERTRKMRLPKR